MFVVDPFPWVVEDPVHPGVLDPEEPIATQLPPENPYKFIGKETAGGAGLVLYDFGARYYTPSSPRWLMMDPLAEKYYSISPYAYCAGDPVNFIDAKGDSLAVLNLGGAIGHTALLIQNDLGEWAYYSMNGDIFYNLPLVDGSIGGKGYHDRGYQTFDSVESFLRSKYNASGTKDQVSNDEVNNYGFSEAYMIPATREQDKMVTVTFCEESYIEYRLFSHNCSIVAGRAFMSASIPAKDGHVPKYRDIISFKPQWFFNNIVNNYNGIYIRVKSQLE